MNAPREHSCPAPADLAALIDGALSPELRTEIIAHVSKCAQCRQVIETVVETEDPAPDSIAEVVPIAPAVERSPSRRTATFAIAAAVLIVVVGATLVIRLARREPALLGQLAASMPETARTVEPRLSGGFRWAPLLDVRRSNDRSTTPEDLVAVAAAGETLRKVGPSRDSHALHAAGVAYLLMRDSRRAVETLDALTRQTPEDAPAWSDLAAARYIDSLSRNDSAALHAALAAADRAIEIDPTQAEAYFNRAVILERAGSESDARAAWTNYLSRDRSSAWAAEARERLQNLPRTRRGAAQ